MEHSMVEIGGSFWVPNRHSIGVYSVTNPDNGAVIFAEFDGNGYTDEGYVIDIAEDDLRNTIGGRYDLEQRYFNPYRPTAEDIRRWTFDAHPLESYLKNSISSAYESLIMQESSKDKEEIFNVNAHAFPRASNDEYNGIIDEMIKAVDLKKFKILLSASAFRQDDKNKPFVTDEIAKQYLEDWADSKLPIYLAFGRKLKLETDYEMNMDVAMFHKCVENLYLKYERYAATIRAVLGELSPAHVFENRLVATPYMRSIFPTLHTKHKLTTLFHALFEDGKFDAELGYLYQDRKVKRKIAISIDPCDYLTMSENQHGWQSCHNIHGGCYGGGGHCYMTDRSTAIAYMYDGTEYLYDISGYKFHHNSKEWRQCVYMCAENGAAIFSRQYPRANDNIAKVVRTLYEDHLEPDAKWILSNTSFPVENYEDDYGMAYHDVLEGYDYKGIRLTKEKTGVLNVGGKVYCIHCGTEIETLQNDGRVICGDCYRKLMGITKKPKAEEDYEFVF